MEHRELLPSIAEFLANRAKILPGSCSLGMADIDLGRELRAVSRTSEGVSLLAGPRNHKVATVASCWNTMPIPERLAALPATRDAQSVYILVTRQGPGLARALLGKQKGVRNLFPYLKDCNRKLPSLRS
jgi:hypothetical protein